MVMICCKERRGYRDGDIGGCGDDDESNTCSIVDTAAVATV